MQYEHYLMHFHYLLAHSTIIVQGETGHLLQEPVSRQPASL